MSALLVSFLSGVIFAFGLGLSGMTRPAKVVGFLDFTGNWDPSLACVMIGAILVHALLYRLIRRRPSPLFAPTFAIPTRQDIDLRLVSGAALFGLGWGIGGFCPGPALTALASGHAAVLIFVAAMVMGMSLHKIIETVHARRAPLSLGTPSTPATAPVGPLFQNRQDY